VPFRLFGMIVEDDRQIMWMIDDYMIDEDYR
jgi:hypothetical protein